MKGGYSITTSFLKQTLKKHFVQILAMLKSKKIHLILLKITSFILEEIMPIKFDYLDGC